MANAGHPTRPARLPYRGAKGAQMFGSSNLLDHERDALIAPCRRWSSDLSEGSLKDIASEILGVFRKWQSRQADGQGFVKVVSGGTSLLSLPQTETLVPLGTVEAWQCAGPLVKNDIDLAFKLWLDADPDFTTLLHRHPVGRVFSLVGLWSWRTAAPESLIRLNGFLVGILIDDINLWREIAGQFRKKFIADKQLGNTNLARAREIKKSKSTTDAVHQALRTAAFEYLRERPLAKNSELIPFLRDHGFDNRAESTIARLIARVRLEVKEHLQSTNTPRTDLYATGQKRNR